MTVHTENIDALNQMVPYAAMIEVTPDNGSDLPQGRADGIFIGVGGDISIDLPGRTGIPSVAIVLKNLSSGELLVAEVDRVRATGTTATDIVACYH